MMALSKRLAQVGRECVASRVDGALCVGCGRCAKVCPADVIAMVERGAGA